MSDKVSDIIGDQANQVFLSSASCWEIVIKYSIGRLDIPGSPDNFILDEIQANSFTVLPISPPHVFEVLNLPDIHGDPFDRMLIAQSINERMGFLTNDSTIKRYNVNCIW